MVEWFQERYISRDEHRKIVEYYRKLVAQLHVSLQELRGAKAAAQTDELPSAAEPKADPEPVQEQPQLEAPEAYGPNVVRFDFRRRASLSRGP